MKSDKGKKYPRIFSIFRKRKSVNCVYAGPERGARVYAGPEPRKPSPQEEEPVPVCVYAGPEYFEELARKRREEEGKAEEAKTEEAKTEEANAEEAATEEATDEEAKANDADDENQ